MLQITFINAIKYTPAEGKVQVIAEQAGDWVKIWVKDTGIGISPEDIPKLFNSQEHFIRKGTQNEKGVGLGLMLCKEFVEKSGGIITVSSQVNEGTTFCFEIPAEKWVLLIALKLQVRINPLIIKF